MDYGFRELDETTGGIKPGELVVIGGRPASGKTALALNITANEERRIKRDFPDKENQPLISFFSTEMNAMKILAGLPDEEEDGKLPKIISHPILMRFQKYTELTAEQIRTDVNQKLEKRKLVLILIDCFQSLEGEPGETALQLKKMAEETGLPVIVISRTACDIEKGAKGIPLAAYFRDAEKLGEIADTVLLTNQDDNDKILSRFPISVARSGSGKSGTVVLDFDDSTSRLSDRD